MDADGEFKHMMTLGFAKGQILAKHLYERRPINVLEFGTYVGYSTMLIAMALPLGAHLITIDYDSRFLLVARV